MTSNDDDKIYRLNYIGSKFKLLDWITANISKSTGHTQFDNLTVADIFAGTGIVSYHFRKLGARVVSNDSEQYSSIITHAFTRSVYNDTCKTVIDTLNKELLQDTYKNTTGFITTQYSPYNGNERMFFTVDNAQRCDYLRFRLDDFQLSPDENAFILASIIASADAVSNVPAVYGCYLKNFKSKATKPLILRPIHTLTTITDDQSKTTNKNVLDPEFLASMSADIAYLDPPYNERQYSKNYFPLNCIVRPPTEALRGKTGIPPDCFISPFCRKAEVVDAFDTLFRGINAKWIFLSYNSESIVSKEKMIELMSKYGNVSMAVCDYKRFKSFEYNDDKPIQEYLFCLQRNDSQVFTK
jgi:adenine-specific DNA-methyltransferase